MLVLGQGDIDRILKLPPELGLTRRHVDQVVKSLPRSRWIPAVVELFRSANKEHQLMKAGIATLVAFYLRDGKKPRGQFFRNVAQLDRALDSTPPELFFVPRLKAGDWGKVKLPEPAIFSTVDGSKEYFSEHQQVEDGVIRYQRCHFLCPKDIRWLKA